MRHREPQGHLGPDERDAPRSGTFGPSPDELLAAIRAEGIKERRLLAAIAELPRAGFVPEDLVEHAYADVPLAIGGGQVTTQPSLVARMLEALAPQPEDRVLEIGTGFGWQTALLARLARSVWSVERLPELAAEARARLERAGVENAEVLVGDGTEGLPAHAPYGAIVVSAAFPSVPEPLAAQLAEGGRLVQPLGHGGSEEVVLFERVADALERRRQLTLARFVRLVGRHGFEG